MIHSLINWIDNLPFHYIHYILYILLSVCFWTTFYAVVRYIFFDHSAEWSSRYVTVFHGSISAIFGIQLCFGDPQPFSSSYIPSTNTQRLVLINSAGYFIHDLIWCLVYKTEAPLMLVHHTFSVCSLIRMSMKSTSAGQGCCGIGTSEVTNPLLQLRWFVREAGYKDTKFFTVVEITFCASFFFVRIIFGTLALLSIKATIETWLLSIFLYLISWLFMINIFVYIKKKYVDEAGLFQTAHAPSSHLVQVDS